LVVITLADGVKFQTVGEESDEGIVDEFASRIEIHVSQIRASVAVRRPAFLTVGAIAGTGLAAGAITMAIPRDLPQVDAVFTGRLR
jgi:hypothetical protein